MRSTMFKLLTPRVTYPDHVLCETRTIYTELLFLHPNSTCYVMDAICISRGDNYFTSLLYLL